MKAHTKKGLSGAFAALIALNTLPAYGAQWTQKTQLSDEGIRAAAVYDVTDNVQYEFSGQCESGQTLSTLIFKIKANSQGNLDKYFPDAARVPKDQSTPSTHPVKVSFGWMSPGNPWQITGNTKGDLNIMTLAFNKHDFYLKKIRRLLKTSTYMTLNIDEPDRNGDFVTAIPLRGLGSVLEAVNQCPGTPKTAEKSVYRDRPLAYSARHSSQSK